MRWSTTTTVIVCCGSGGVGKTTTAAAIAVEAARRGRRACVVTIDPAKRLADALGLDALTNDPGRVDGDWPGELWALMLDTKSTFDALVSTYAVDRSAGRGHPRATASTATSPARCRARRSTWRWRSSTSCTPSGRFDLVVVDTPPTRNALDFLDAPAPAHPVPRQPDLPAAVMPTRAYLKAVSVATQAFLRTMSQRGRGRSGRRRRGVLPGLRRHGTGFPRPGPEGARPARGRHDGIRAGRLTPTGHRRRGDVLRREAGRRRVSPSMPWSSTGCIPASAKEATAPNGPVQTR